MSFLSRILIDNFVLHFVDALAAVLLLLWFRHKRPMTDNSFLRLAASIKKTSREKRIFFIKSNF
jgi:hypothetical protein